jgi:hypothetical protein
VRVLLLTATPVVNSPSDTINLFAMAMKEDPISPRAFDSLWRSKDVHKLKPFISFLHQNQTDYPNVRVHQVRLTMPQDFYKEYHRIEQQQFKGRPASSIINADADVFVFPSFTDTFGLVILEAAATGTPVAGFVAPGPQDILPGTGAGIVDDDLQKACLEALKLKREDARALAERYSWAACAEDFRRNLEPLPKERGRRFWHKLADLRKRAKERRRIAKAKRQAEREAANRR